MGKMSEEEGGREIRKYDGDSKGRRGTWVGS